MPVRPPYYKQETEYSCMAACLRMVLEHLGVVKTEKELRVLTDCDFDSSHYPRALIYFLRVYPALKRWAISDRPLRGQ